MFITTFFTSLITYAIVDVAGRAYKKRKDAKSIHPLAQDILDNLEDDWTFVHPAHKGKASCWKHIKDEIRFTTEYTTNGDPQMYTFPVNGDFSQTTTIHVFSPHELSLINEKIKIYYCNKLLDSKIKTMLLNDKN